MVGGRPGRLAAESAAVAAGIEYDVWRDKVVRLTDRLGDMSAVTAIGPQQLDPDLPCSLRVTSARPCRHRPPKTSP
ncbi:hypothetical protein [Streptomyces sp. AC555_RSS877]|uniref:hypothetical protein n=1 Tax=Streptomyces sp. AC555_RSS877 TaxID=2823688 RepID=UPI001C2570C0|nr:hypothetical protein [Streptomyces sp. AC555_RSS877]